EARPTVDHQETHPAVQQIAPHAAFHDIALPLIRPKDGNLILGEISKIISTDDRQDEPEGRPRHKTGERLPSSANDLSPFDEYEGDQRERLQKVQPPAECRDTDEESRDQESQNSNPAAEAPLDIPPQQDTHDERESSTHQPSINPMQGPR